MKENHHGNGEKMTQVVEDAGNMARAHGQPERRLRKDFGEFGT